ncbi:MAG TPA: IF-2-associated domain-containing protein, partial [Bacteroidia bacterium]|nr:IF-2-associated domain-containing protein [Bacteroidia bacterium]
MSFWVGVLCHKSNITYGVSTTEIKQADASGKARTIQVEVRKKRVFVKRDEPGAGAEDVAAKAAAEDAELARREEEANRQAEVLRQQEEELAEKRRLREAEERQKQEAAARAAAEAAEQAAKEQAAREAAESATATPVAAVDAQPAAEPVVAEAAPVAEA